MSSRAPTLCQHANVFAPRTTDCRRARAGGPTSSSARRATRRSGAPCPRRPAGRARWSRRSPCLPPQSGRRSSSSGAAGADDEQGDIRVNPVHEMIDEAERPVVGPVEVLEDEHERRWSPAPRRSAARQRTPPCVRSSGLGPVQADERTQMRTSTQPASAWIGAAFPTAARFHGHLARRRSRGSLPAPSSSRRAPSS